MKHLPSTAFILAGGKSKRFIESGGIESKVEALVTHGNRPPLTLLGNAMRFAVDALNVKQLYISARNPAQYHNFSRQLSMAQAYIKRQGFHWNLEVDDVVTYPPGPAIGIATFMPVLKELDREPVLILFGDNLYIHDAEWAMDSDLDLRIGEDLMITTVTPQNDEDRKRLASVEMADAPPFRFKLGQPVHNEITAHNQEHPHNPNAMHFFAGLAVVRANILAEALEALASQVTVGNEFSIAKVLSYCSAIGRESRIRRLHANREWMDVATTEDLYIARKLWQTSIGTTLHKS